MTTLFDNSYSLNKRQYIIFILIAIGAVGLITLLNCSNSHIFDRFFGRLNPVIICSVISILGLLCLSYLLSNGLFKIHEKKESARLLRILGLTLLFVSITILIDIKVHFPIDMNIAFPKSIFFYPAIGFIVEILFHIFPITIIIFCFSYTFKNTNIKKLIWISIIITATLEPIFQAFSMTSYSIWTVILVWINLYLFNFTQLIIFKRFDFVSMYSFRLIYYLIWHIIWGHERLTLLF